MAPPQANNMATNEATQPRSNSRTITTTTHVQEMQPTLRSDRCGTLRTCSRAAAAKSKVLADWASVELFGAANRCAAARTRRVQPSKKARHRRTREMAGRQSVCQCSCLCCAVSCALA